MSTKTVTINSNVGKLVGMMRQRGLLKAVTAGGLVVRNYAIINIGKTFKRVHGVPGLSDIIVSTAQSSGKSAAVDVGPTVVYGRIHELGGFIRPIKAKRLRWVDEDGKVHFAKVVQMPKRPYLEPAMADHIDEISAAIEASLNFQIKGTL